MRPNLLAAVASALAVAHPLLAQPAPSFDHLQCFEIRDPIARATATTDLVPEHGAPFQEASGCRIRFPAKYFCTDVAKQNVAPPPVGSVGGAAVGEYYCYRLACPRATAPARGSTIAAADQFGARVLRLAKRSPLLCVPAVRVASTPTPVVTPSASDVSTPTSSSGTPTPVIGSDPGCSFDGNECQGACVTAGRCQYDPQQNRCVCPAAFDTECNQFGVIAECGHGGLLCPGPGQVCVLAEGPSCQCVRPTPQPTP